MGVYIDPTQTTTGNVDSVAVDGTPYTAESAVMIQVTITDPASLLAGYTATDPASPSETVSRQIARAVLDALAAYTP